MCKNGDIFMAKLDEDMDGGSLQAGFRPVLIVSNDKANEFSHVINIIPMSSKLKRSDLPKHVLIKNCGLIKESIVLAEQITSLNKNRLGKYVGSIKETVYEKQVKKAIEVQLNL